MSVCKQTFSIRSFIKARISLAHNAGHDYLSCGKDCWKLYRWEQSASVNILHWTSLQNSGMECLNLQCKFILNLPYIQTLTLQIPVLQQIYGIIVGPATRFPLHDIFQCWSRTFQSVSPTAPKAKRLEMRLKRREDFQKLRVLMAPPLDWILMYLYTVYTEICVKCIHILNIYTCNITIIHAIL